MSVYTTSGHEAISSEDSAAADVTYDNATSGLAATNVQDALDELADFNTLNRIGGTAFAHQEADNVITSNSTYADTDLVIDIPEAGTYLIESSIQLTNNATPDTKIRQHFTGTSTAYKTTGCVGLGASAFMNTATVLDTDSVFTSAGLHSSTFSAVMTCTTGGVWSLQSAQNVSNAASITAPHSGGWVKITRIG